MRQRATALTSSLSQGITTAKTNITQALAQFNANLTSAQTPAPGAAQSLVKEAREFLDQKINTAVTQLETGINNGASQVTQSGQTAVGSINNAASQAISTAENTASQSNSALDELKANADNSFAQLENGHSQTLDNTVTDASNFFSQQSSNLGSKIDSVVANLNSKLAESTNQLTSGLRHGLAQERADIDKAANQAAAKVKPAWKQIVSVAIDVVITVGTTVAIAALAASGLGLPAAIGLAALIGAAGGVARLAAEDALNGQMSSWQEYVEEGAIGAGSGVLQLLGGKAVEKFASPLASKIAQKAAQIGIDTATNTLTDLGTRLANGEKLSLSTVGISLGSSLLGSAGGEALSGSFGKLAKKVQLDRVDNKLLQNSSDLVFDTIGNVTVDMANLTLLQGQSLSLSSLGESVGSSALGHVTGKKIHSHNGNNRSRSLDRTESNPQRIGNQPEINNNLTSIDRQVTSSDLASTSSSESSNPSVVNNNRELAAASENETTGARHRRTTIEDPSTANNKVDSQQDRTSQTNNLQRAENFDKYLTPQTRGKVPVYVDPTLQGNTVRVHYDVDKNGLVTGIHMRCGPDAKPHDIALHERTARTMQRYSGFSGRVMQIKARLQKWVGMHGEPPVGSRAWEARMEVDKLNRIIKHRLDMKAELGLKDNDQTALDAEIKHLEEQLARHEKTLEDMDRDPGVGYVAAEGYSELHNHYTGVPSPEKFLKTTKYQEDSQKALQDLHELFLGKIPEDPEKGKQHRFVRKYRKKELDILKQRLEKEGLIDKEGKLSTEIDPETAKTVMEDLLSSRNGMPFDSVYMFRGLLNPNPQKLKEAVVEELDAQGIKHAELQGTPFGKQDPETFARPNNSQVWFLKLQSGTKRLTPKKGGSLSKSDKKAIETLGTERNVGIDFAGAEDKEFTSAGMKRWQEYYSEIKKKADIDNATYVLRTHAGEGYSQRDEKGNFSSNSNHREIANKNVGQIVDALEQMANKGQLSKNVVVRLGHVTHADFEQLERLAKLSHEHGIIVEANPSSNLATGSVRDKNEMRQVLLKFLHHDGLRTTLNTDGGGVMGTTISEEYDKAEEAIELFKEGEIGLVDEKRKIIYHYSEDQMPRPRDRNPDYEYKAITEEQRNNFDIERLKQESDRYLDEIAPNIGSREQRQQSRSTKRTLAQSSSNDDREGLETKKSKRSQK
ncbi:MAG: hypothetical protein QNJ54_09925 [Prochloraceae cyanobacterium]|nr:hypothetical protein [Prochloraceae cyanobacterium]